MITVLSPKSYPQLVELIQETEPIDSILSAGIDEDGVIFCLALEGDEQISVKIGDTIETRPFNAESQTVKMAAPDPDLVDEYVERIEKQNHFKPWLEQTQELLMQSSDLNEFSDLLDSLYPDLSSVEFSKAMRGAMTAASMGGYFEAISGDDAEFAKIPEGTVRDDKILHNSRWHLADTKDLLKQHKETYDNHVEFISKRPEVAGLPPELIGSAAEYLTMHRAYGELYGGDKDKHFDKLQELADRFQESFYDAVDDKAEDDEYDRVQEMLDKLMKTVGFSAADTEIEGELEFKQAEGSKRTKNGVEYVLINSRWRRADKKKAPQPVIEPVAEIAKTHKQLISDFFKDPKKSIEDGMAREKAALDNFAVKHSSSKSLELADKALKLRSDTTELIKKNSDTIKATAIGEGLPIIGSLAGSAIGTALAGSLGAMAGNAIGSTGTRKAMEVVGSYKKAAAALATDEAHSSASKLQQFKNIGAGTLSDLKEVETQKALQNSLVGDIGGWAIGNAVGKALSSAMPTGYGPLIGAVGASMALVPNVIQPLAAQAHDLVRAGASPKDAVIKVTADLVGKGDNAVKGLRSKLVSGLNILRSKVRSN